MAWLAASSATRGGAFMANHECRACGAPVRPVIDGDGIWRRVEYAAPQGDAAPPKEESKMSDVMTPIAKDDPRWVAWNRYKASPEFANTRRWPVTDPETYIDGALWAAFIEGWGVSSSGSAPEPQNEPRTP